ncbi:MAG: GYD domain-containing protein [Caldilineaceae bacterium]|nr:GYD domain-containing protein [Caldilineaceae bacterium]MCB0139718.1 GYD domain-containing protein [Caldilineaceae bacterium]MCB9157052.1 GYD domain-containing protein [Caldilineaceae bacterium]
MPKFLVQGSYGPGGAQAILKEGASARRAAVEKAVTSLGGTLEAFYFAFGDVDLYVIMELPNTTAAIAASLVTNASGTVGAKTTMLIMPEEVDAAAKMDIGYRPPRSD